MKLHRNLFVPLAPALLCMLVVTALPGAVTRAQAQGVESYPTRSIRIATNEVTDPDVAVSADGTTLVFTALGHLFQLPAAGGATKQLTSGPFYDAAPAISSGSGGTRERVTFRNGAHARTGARRRSSGESPGS